MIKECKILNYNKYQHIVVAMFDGVQVQCPATLDEDATVCYIEKVGDIFKISSADKFKSANKPKVKKNVSKAEPKEEAKEESVDEEIEKTEK